MEALLLVQSLAVVSKVNHLPVNLIQQKLCISPDQAQHLAFLSFLLVYYFRCLVEDYSVGVVVGGGKHKQLKDSKLIPIDDDFPTVSSFALYPKLIALLFEALIVGDLVGGLLRSLIEGKQ